MWRVLMDEKNQIKGYQNCLDYQSYPLRVERNIVYNLPITIQEPSL